MKKKIRPRNPIARAMLEQRQSPKAIPPKKGSKAKHNRQKGNKDALRNQEFPENTEA
tara:strand:- start:1569 stop:1739 length:171 start_codon:yes stop_codon:yes gene_type:complete